MQSDSEICTNCIKDYVARTGQPFDYYRCEECTKEIYIRREDAVEGNGFGKHDVNNPLWNLNDSKKDSVK